VSKSFNSITLLGNTGGDPEVRNTAGGQKVATVSLATSREWKDVAGNKQEKTEWHRLVVWGSLAEVVEKYVKKGDKLMVTGSLEYSQWKDKEGQTRYTTEIRVRELVMLGSPEKSPSERQKVGAKSGFDDFPAALEDQGDDLPF
jgi:single-strand DNA-binding protein